MINSLPDKGPAGIYSARDFRLYEHFTVRFQFSIILYSMLYDNDGHVLFYNSFVIK